jgi:phosphate transport system permease protein
VTLSTTDLRVGGAAAPRPRQHQSRPTRTDRWFRGVTSAAGGFTFLILFLIGLFLFITAWPAFQSQGWHFFTTVGFVTEPSRGHPAKFGVQSAMLGTIIISIIALVIAVPVSLTSALFISEYAPRKLLGFIPLKNFLTSVVDLMAAVPSVIYGLWGFLVLAPHMAGVSRWLSDHFSFIPFFRVPAGTTVFTGSAFIAGVLVGIMVLPIVTSISREVFSLAPIAEREGAAALGASRARVIRDVVLPFGKGGVIGAIMLGLGRALGEAIAVSIIISLAFQNNFHILVAPSNSVAGLIAVRFGSGGNLGLAALLAAGLVLFVFTLIVNTIASIVVNRTRQRRVA